MSKAKEQSESGKDNPIKKVFKGLIFIIIGIVAFLFLVPRIVWEIIKDINLRFKFWNMAVRQGRFILFVYSNSPNWKSHIEENILPQIRDRAVILNRSERNQWDNTSWAVQAFQHWGGRENFNPLAVIFCNLINVRVIRFYNAFHDLEKGEPSSLQKAQAQLFKLAKTKTV